LLAGLKIRAFEYLAKQEFIRQRALKKQFKSYYMVDPDTGVVESSMYVPEWGHSLTMGDFSGTEAGARAIKNSLALPGSSQTHGNYQVTLYRPGHVDIECVPTLVPLVLTGVEITEDSVIFSEKGIGGAPDLIRLFTSSCKRRVETPMNGGGVSFEIEYPLYRKVVIGLDDTDSSTKGATFVTALRIAGIVEKVVKGTKFLRLTLSLNWPRNPAKTTNNASSALVFAVKPGREEELINQFTRLATRYTISKETGMTAMNKVQAPEPLITYARKVKSVHVDISEAFKVADQTGVRAIPITGERGLIGALSATGLVDHPGEAISPVDITSI
jgi:methanogenesis imperfect marker protein 11